MIFKRERQDLVLNNVGEGDQPADSRCGVCDQVGMCAINSTDLALGGSKDCVQPSTFSRVHEQEEVLAVPPLFLQESGHSGGIGFGRRPC